MIEKIDGYRSYGKIFKTEQEAIDYEIYINKTNKLYEFMKRLPLYPLPEEIADHIIFGWKEIKEIMDG